jgi:hypothetical protein
VYPTFAVLLLGLAALSAVASSAPQRRSTDRGASAERLRGFLVVGAAALVLWSVVVVVSGVVNDRAARAEGLGMLAFFAYPFYLLGALALEQLSRRRAGPQP